MAFGKRLEGRIIMITWDSVKKNLKSISPDEMRAIEEKAKSSILSSAKKQKPIVLDTDEKIEKYLKS